MKKLCCIFDYILTLKSNSEQVGVLNQQVNLPFDVIIPQPREGS